MQEIVELAMRDILNQKDIVVEISMFEIYNEETYDLLTKSNS